jgi:putative IMPACT (imprinted ancient) family translation regulator
MEYGSANHCCHAFRVVWPRFDEYFSDDGEPSGSSGRPILNQMRRRGLDQGLMVVVRFFGGIKLGIPGLIEAYGEAARLALEAAKLTPFVPLTSIRIHCSLAEVGRLHGELARMGFSGEHIKESYGENGGVLSLKIPWDSVALLEDRLNEWTALGRVTNFIKDCEEISMDSHRGMSN